MPVNTADPQPLRLDQLPNSYRVFMISKFGPAHDMILNDVNSWLTRCGQLGRSEGFWLTVAQVDVWLRHEFCLRCFTHRGGV